ncbi:SRPBCC family protein [Tenacibaculum sp.]|uniref:SRPBCC family protein n=1 Tax=Tenacibaculum sp. TaxID=1906242 RepID=UPI003D0FB63B
MPRIKLITYINSSREVVFDLSRSIELHKISTKKTKEKVIAGKMTGLIELNESATWRAKHLGFYQELTSKIIEYNYPEYFVDEMQKGAFKNFRHEHYFFEETTEGVKMVNVFEYESPFGFLGKLIDKIFLEKYMVKLLLERNRVIKEFAETNLWKKILPA